MAKFIPIEFQKAFEKTQQTAFRLTAHYTADENTAKSRLSSLFGGIPYWEAGHAQPEDADGKPLALLAQINFADMPTHPDLPDHGIVQFFIPTDQDDYGANFDHPETSNGLVVRTWTTPNPDKIADWSGKVDENDLIPVFGAHLLTFSTKDDYAGIDTIECAEALQRNPFEVLEDTALNEAEETQFFDAITDFTDSHGHKLLGYPYFIQSEPRETSDYRLLLQIDTDMDDDNDIMWGDNGIAQLFIRPDDLHEQRFDRCWFYWDCG